MKDFHVFCNKTWLKQHREASSLNIWRSSIVITLSDIPGIKKANQVSRTVFKYRCFSWPTKNSL